MPVVVQVAQNVPTISIKKCFFSVFFKLVSVLVRVVI